MHATGLDAEPEHMLRMLKEFIRSLETVTYLGYEFSLLTLALLILLCKWITDLAPKNAREVVPWKNLPLENLQPCNRSRVRILLEILGTGSLREYVPFILWKQNVLHEA